MPSWLPSSLHRALLPVAYRLRHIWRTWSGKRLIGCAVVITNLSGDVLLLRHSYGPKVWSLPGGGVDVGEDPEAAIRREMSEELGLTLEHVEPVAVLEEVVARSPHTGHLFASVCDALPVPDGREVIEARFFPSHSLPEPMGRITRARIDAWRKRDVAGG